LSKQPNVLIFESSLSGHRANFVAIHAREFLQLGAKVSLAIPQDALAQPEAILLGDILDQTRYIPLPKIDATLSVLSSSRAKLDLLQQKVRDAQADHCFVPYADGLSQAWGMKLRPDRLFNRNLVIEGLTMRSRFAYPQLNLKDRLSASISYHATKRASWNRLHFLDPLGHQYLVQRNQNLQSNYLIPDIVEKPGAFSQAESRQRLKLPTDAHIIACPGAVSEAKGSDKLIDAVLESGNQKLKLVLLGKHSPSLKAKLEKVGHEDRIVSMDRFADESEFCDLFAAANTIAVCYPRHCGSASILIRAAAYGKSIIGSDWGWIGWAIKTFDLGLTCNTSDPQSISDALAQISQSNHQQTAVIERFVDYHSPSNHLAHWTDLYRQRFGLPRAMRVDFSQVSDTPIDAKPTT